MASSSASGCTHCRLRLPRPLSSFPSSSSVPILPVLSPFRPTTPCMLSSSTRLLFTMAAVSGNHSNPTTGKNKEENQQNDVEEEVEPSWIEEKALDLVEFSGSVVQAIPGPRVGRTSLPWMLALPLAYAGITFVIAFVKTVQKFSSPKEKRRRKVNKNATLLKSLDEVLLDGRDEGLQSALKELMQKTGFSMEEIFRKYLRYVLNEKPFTSELVATLIQFRKATVLDDSQVAQILNEISTRIVRDKGPVVMDTLGYSKKGMETKIAVQALFGKIFYLSELPAFCSRDSSLVIKEIFGVTDEDADKIRMHTLSEAGDVDSLEKMMGS